MRNLRYVSNRTRSRGLRALRGSGGPKIIRKIWGHIYILIPKVCPVELLHLRWPKWSPPPGPDLVGSPGPARQGAKSRIQNAKRTAECSRAPLTSGSFGPLLVELFLRILPGLRPKASELQLAVLLHSWERCHSPEPPLPRGGLLPLMGLPHPKVPQTPHECRGVGGRQPPNRGGSGGR